jgi:protein-S-isoprenylcysteine O-methyltransferase Ste14
MLWRYLPLIGILLIVLISAGVRPWLQYRRYGTLGVLLFRSGRRSQNLRDAALVLLFALLIGQAAAAATGRQRPALLVAGQGELPDMLRAGGAILMLGGTMLLAAAQLNMGASWRVGIRDGDAPGLVMSGLYRFCRNPIYLGLLTALAGYAALLPTTLSLALLVAAYAGIRLQVAAEEAYLERTYGEAFRAYARRVGRFLPWIGRL